LGLVVDDAAPRPSLLPTGAPAERAFWLQVGIADEESGKKSELVDQRRPSRPGTDRTVQARIGRKFLRSRCPPRCDIAEPGIVLAANRSGQRQREGQIDRLFAAVASTQELGM